MQEKTTDFDLEVITASITDKVNSTTKHEPFEWGTRKELVKRELGVFLVKAFCKEINTKDDVEISSKWEMDVAKMEDYIEFHKDEVRE